MMIPVPKASHSEQTWEGAGIYPQFKDGKLRHKDFERLARDHTWSRWQSQERQPGSETRYYALLIRDFLWWLKIHGFCGKWWEFSVCLFSKGHFRPNLHPGLPWQLSTWNLAQGKIYWQWDTAAMERIQPPSSSSPESTKQEGSSRPTSARMWWELGGRTCG